MFDGTVSVWLIVGFVGQAMFGSRFLVQWIASERRKESVVPDVFWWMSLGGGVCLLSYAIFRRDAVFVVGQSSGLIVYLRNLVLVRRQRRAESAPGD